MVFLTALSLIYIQLQVQIYDLGYQGEIKKTEAQRLTDDNGYAAYNVSRLKSANNLGVKLLTNNSKMQFLDNKHIVRLKAPVELLDGDYLAKAQMHRLAKKPNLLAGVFSLKSQAEAQPIK